MADLIGSANWAIYEQIIRDAHDTFFQEEIVWIRYAGKRNIHGEDKEGEFEHISLKGLFQYNVFRVWSMDGITNAGEVDLGNTAVFFNLKYLEELGYVNSRGMFLYYQDRDKFTHRGVAYKSTGYTLVSQAKDKPLLLQVNLQRDNIDTGTTQYGE